MSNNNKKEIRQYYDSMPEHIMADMDLGGIDSVRDYLNGLIEARSNNIVSDYTSYKRMLELYQHAEVKHGKEMATMLTKASAILLRTNTNFEGSTKL